MCYLPNQKNIFKAVFIWDKTPRPSGSVILFSEYASHWAQKHIHHSTACTNPKLDIYVFNSK